MSATFKNAKKKMTQLELRKLMNEHKGKIQTVKKIESPLAKYNDLGQLTCILCQSVVRSEVVWQVHVNSKQHRQSVENAKQLKEKTNNFTKAVKRTCSPPPQIAKRVKGILKNASDVPRIVAPTKIEVVSKKAPVEPVKESEPKAVTDLPEDFFDSKDDYVKATSSKNEEMEVDDADGSEQLPEGFFDDPKLDAKARNVEYKDPIEEEWEKFQKEIKDADYQSAAIIAEDQEEATNERQIDDIDEQLKNWSRVVNLEKKKVEIIAQQVGDVAMQEDTQSSSDDDNFDEYLDWRSKQAYK